jgi:hypothetical protein
MDVNMIMNTMKNDINKRWIIHNLNQQEVNNPRIFENLYKKKGVIHTQFQKESNS